MNILAYFSYITILHESQFIEIQPKIVNRLCSLYDITICSYTYVVKQVQVAFFPLETDEFGLLVIRFQLAICRPYLEFINTLVDPRFRNITTCYCDRLVNLGVV